MFAPVHRVTNILIWLMGPAQLLFARMLGVRESRR